MSAATRRRRFALVVTRGLARADREHAEHLARIRALPTEGGRAASRARVGQLLRPLRRRP